MLPTGLSVGRSRLLADVTVTFSWSPWLDHCGYERIESGHDWLDNNGVNVLMAATMSLGAMAIAQMAWGVNVRELL